MANDRNAPATKGDLDDPETRLKAERGARLTETMGDIQAVPVRFTAQEDATANTGKKIERRLNTPSAA